MTQLLNFTATIKPAKTSSWKYLLHTIMTLGYKKFNIAKYRLSNEYNCISNNIIGYDMIKKNHHMNKQNHEKTDQKRDHGYKVYALSLII